MEGEIIKDTERSDIDDKAITGTLTGFVVESSYGTIKRRYLIQIHFTDDFEDGSWSIVSEVLLPDGTSKPNAMRAFFRKFAEMTDSHLPMGKLPF